jgi:hypothetical protein
MALLQAEEQARAKAVSSPLAKSVAALIKALTKE